MSGFQPIELLSLPVELQIHIVQWLCPHCMPGALPPDGLSRPQTLRTAQPLTTALARLSQTCRHLLVLVRPFLYHRVAAKGKSLMPLMRLFRENPSLRDLVREIHVDVNVPRIVFTLGELRYANSLLEELQLVDLPTLRSIDEDQRLDDTVIRFSEFNDLNREYSRALSCILINLVPFVKSLSIVVNNWDHLPLPKSSLSNVKWLIVSSGDRTGGFELDSVANIVRACPNLERFTGQRVYGMGVGPQPKHKTCREVDFHWSIMGTHAFFRVMRNFTGLERFSYHSAGANINGGGEPLPSEYSEALLQRANSLKHVSIKIEDNFRVISHTQEIVPTKPMKSLKNMEYLETLALVGHAIAENATKGSLVDFLPGNIQEFTLFPDNDLFFEALMEVGEWKASGRGFGQLKMLKLLGFKPDLELRRALAAKFKTAGVIFICLF